MKEIFGPDSGADTSAGGCQGSTAAGNPDPVAAGGWPNPVFGNRVDAAILDENGSDELIILDQTLLPGEVKYLRLSNAEEVREAIYQLKVRGAPAIGNAAAMGLYASIKDSRAETWDDFHRELAAARAVIGSARPTAVNLFWALDRMERAALGARALPVPDIKRILREEALAIRAGDEETCRMIGENGLALLEKGWGLLTHCNAGTLATARYGTATAPMYLGHERGYGFRIFADETRPLLQGARLTAWELTAAGLDVTLICDNMASIVMKQGKIDAVLVGCDRVAANGDAANKIGTSGVAILAAHYRIPFYVCGPLSTIDRNCPTGEYIEIEERPGAEITEKWYARPMAPAGVKAYNPAFDVTDHALITAIVTERGIARPPYGESIARLFEGGKCG